MFHNTFAKVVHLQSVKLFCVCCRLAEEEEMSTEIKVEFKDKTRVSDTNRISIILDCYQ